MSKEEHIPGSPYNSVEYYPPGHKEWSNVASIPPPLVKEQDEETFLIKLIADHWNYIEAVLTEAGGEAWDIREIGFHYRTAFRHGWKHHKEYADANHA